MASQQQHAYAVQASLVHAGQWGVAAKRTKERQAFKDRALHTILALYEQARAGRGSTKFPRKFDNIEGAFELRELRGQGLT